MSREKLSKHQQEVVDWLTANGGIIERWKGGFWTVPSMTTHGADEVPDKSTSIQTIRSLERKGYLENIEPDAPEGRARRKIKKDAAQ